MNINVTSKKDGVEVAEILKVFWPGLEVIVNENGGVHWVSVRGDENLLDKISRLLKASKSVRT